MCVCVCVRVCVCTCTHERAQDDTRTQLKTAASKELFKVLTDFGALG